MKTSSESGLRPTSAAPAQEWPSVTAVVPTHARPREMRRAVESILAQSYPGDLTVLVVFDQSSPDATLGCDSPGRRVRVLTNQRTPGLAGARNTGILAAQDDLVAFCDDDDTWEPGKLRAQVEAMLADPDAEFATTAMTVDFGDRSTVRLAGRANVHHLDLLRSRMAMLHSSSFLVRRAALTHDIGLVDETLPRSMAEDWDLLLRAARRRPIVHVDRPLVRVSWGADSYFATQWEVRNEAHLWLLQHHPEMARDALAAGLVYGKLAFGTAALGRRREAFRWAWRSGRANWREPRYLLAVAVALRLVSWQWVMRRLNERGHGL